MRFFGGGLAAPQQPSSRVKLIACRAPAWMAGSAGLQARTGAPQLAGLPRRRHQQRLVPRRLAPLAAEPGQEPGGWSEWEDEGDLVAQATSSTPEVACWGAWGQQQERQQHARQEQQAAAEQMADSTGRVGETQHPQASTSGRAGAGRPMAQMSAAAHAIPPPPPRPSGLEVRYFTTGAIAAVALHYLVNFAGTLPVVRSLVRRFVWWSDPRGSAPAEGPSESGAGRDGGEQGSGPGSAGGTTALAVQYSEDEESVEWVNMCWRKAWRVYQRGLERWLADLLQPLFDSLVEDKMVPSFVQRLRILEFTLDHEAPYFTNMRRRTSRKDSDLNGVVDVRYTGGARMLLLVEAGSDRWRIKIPVMVSDLDLEAKLWVKIRLAPMCPWIGTLGLGFVGAPSIKVQLAPYNRIRLMKIPIIQAFLTKLLTIDVPALMILPRRLEINIPPAVTAVAEAAVGRDAVMRAVASAVLQADALEHALLAALPLGPQGAAGGVSLPDLFSGELEVTLHEARDLPVWGFPWQSNPYCRITLGSQAEQSRRDADTSHAGRHRAPVWNQDYQFLVEDPATQVLEIWVGDSPMTGRTEVGTASFPLSQLAADGTADVWLPVESSMPGERTQGAVHLVITYKPFQDDVADSGYRAAAAFATLAPQSSEITDMKSAADASSRAAVAASAAAAAVAVTKAAAARAAARIARAATAAQQLKEAPPLQLGGGGGNGSNGSAGSSDVNDSTTAPLLLPHPSAVGVDGEGTGVAADGGSDGVADGVASSAGPPVGSSTVEQLSAMAATMQKLTAEVDGIVHSSTRAAHSGLSSGGGGCGNGASSGGSGLSIDPEVKVAAVEAVAAAEAAAISAVAAGDLAGANRVLRDAATALESTVAQLVAAESNAAAAQKAEAAAAAAEAGGTPPQAAADPPTPKERAELALAAAHAAAAQAAAAAAAVPAAGGEALSAAGPAAGRGLESAAGGAELGRATALMSTDELVGLDAAPAAEAAEERGRGLPDYDAAAAAAKGSGSLPQPKEQRPAWWLALTAWLPGPPRGGDSDAAAGAAAEADGGVGPPTPPPPPSPHQQAQVVRQAGGGSGGSPGPVSDVIIPADLPLEEIQAEVLKSWQLRDTHVESLVQKAVEARRKQKERPLLQLLAVGSVASAVLLAAVLYHLQHMPQ